MGSIPSTRDTRAGIRVRLRGQHRRRSHDEEHPEQHRCNATIIREGVTGQSISVISIVDNIRRRLQRAMKETGLLNSQDNDRVVEDSLDEEGEEMVADDVKKGSIPIRLVNQAKTEEQKYIKKMKVLDVVDRKEASRSKVIRTKWVVTNKGTPEKPNVRARWVAQEYCEGGVDVVGVVTPLVGGVAQAFHDDRVVELRVQLGVQEVEGKEDREEQVEVERERRVKEVRPWI